MWFGLIKLEMDSKKQLSLADILKSIFSNWILVVISTFVFGGLFFFYVKNSKPSYKTSSTLFLDFNKSIETRFGSYKPENANSKDFLTLLESDNIISQTISEFDLDLTAEDFGKGLNLEFPEYEDSRSVQLEVTLSDSNVDQILNYHITNFIDNLKRYHQLKAINYFKLVLNNGLRTLEQEREQIEELIPIKDSTLKAMSPSDFSARQVKRLEQQGFDVSVHDFWSPEYQVLSGQLVQMESKLIEVNYKIDQHKKFRDELVMVEKKVKSEGVMDFELYGSQNYVTSFIESGQNKVIEFKRSIYKFTVLGLFVGFLFSIFIIFIIALSRNIKA